MKNILLLFGIGSLMLSVNPLFADGGEGSNPQDRNIPYLGSKKISLNALDARVTGSNEKILSRPSIKIKNNFSAQLQNIRLKRFKDSVKFEKMDYETLSELNALAESESPAFFEKLAQIKPQYKTQLFSEKAADDEPLVLLLSDRDYLENAIQTQVEIKLNTQMEHCKDGHCFWDDFQEINRPIQFRTLCTLTQKYSHWRSYYENDSHVTTFDMGDLTQFDSIRDVKFLNLSLLSNTLIDKIRKISCTDPEQNSWSFGLVCQLEPASHVNSELAEKTLKDTSFKVLDLNIYFIDPSVKTQTRRTSSLDPNFNLMTPELMHDSNMMSYDFSYIDRNLYIPYLMSSYERGPVSFSWFVSASSHLYFQEEAQALDALRKSFILEYKEKNESFKSYLE